MSEKERNIERGLVSIVVPVYNAGAFISETIRHVQAQTYRKWELLLVDDCSADNSAELIREQIRKDGRIRLVTQKENGGARGRATVAWRGLVGSTYAFWMRMIYGCRISLKQSLLT